MRGATGHGSHGRGSTAGRADAAARSGRRSRRRNRRAARPVGERRGLPIEPRAQAQAERRPAGLKPAAQPGELRIDPRATVGLVVADRPAGHDDQRRGGGLDRGEIADAGVEPAQAQTACDESRLDRAEVLERDVAGDERGRSAAPSRRAGPAFSARDRLARRPSRRRGARRAAPAPARAGRHPARAAAWRCRPASRHRACGSRPAARRRTDA